MSTEAILEEIIPLGHRGPQNCWERVWHEGPTPFWDILRQTCVRSGVCVCVPQCVCVCGRPPLLRKKLERLPCTTNLFHFCTQQMFRARWRGLELPKESMVPRKKRVKCWKSCLAKGWRCEKRLRSLVSVSCNQCFVGLPRLAPVLCILSRSVEENTTWWRGSSGGVVNEMSNCLNCCATILCESVIGLLSACSPRQSGWKPENDMKLWCEVLCGADESTGHLCVSSVSCPKLICPAHTLE